LYLVSFNTLPELLSHERTDLDYPFFSLLQSPTSSSWASTRSTRRRNSTWTCRAPGTDWGSTSLSELRRTNETEESKNREGTSCNRRRVESGSRVSHSCISFRRLYQSRRICSFKLLSSRCETISCTNRIKTTRDEKGETEERGVSKLTMLPLPWKKGRKG